MKAIQIDEFGDMPVHRTGAIYRKDNQTNGETLNQIAARPIGEWNDYEIHVQDQVYRVNLNGTEVCVFDNTSTRGGVSRARTWPPASSASRSTPTHGTRSPIGMSASRRSERPGIPAGGNPAEMPTFGPSAFRIVSTAKHEPGRPAKVGFGTTREVRPCP